MFSCAASPVHPRACGERVGSKSNVYIGDGSSPRVRGTGLSDLQRGHGVRFIPARAGNGEGRETPPSCHAVHPRACGERTHFVCRRSPQTGSSPRVGGTVVKAIPIAVVERFIPARAGNGRPRPCTSAEATVHPRACGERGDRKSVV